MQREREAVLPAPALHDFGVGALKPTASSPIIVRSPADSKVTITNDLTVSGLDYVRLQGLHVGQASLSFSSVSGPALASCVVKAPVTFTGCTDAKVIGNTFDTRTTGETVTFTNCTGARVRNNVFWNDGVEPGLTWTGTAPDSDVNLYYPADISPAETNSVSVDPGLDSTDYTVLGSASAAFTNKGVVESAFRADVQGWYRHLSFPCRGAFEYQVIENSGVDAMGRVTGRTIAGRPHTLSYDAQGRLTSATSLDGTSVTYEYDHLGRRVLTTHYSPLTTHQTRMVYDGTDVVADIVDEDGDGTVDRQRLYWILPQIDQRIGFVDIEGNEAKAYYYVTDQVGSVLQVLDSSGAVVNQYNYDAWGNLLADGTFEGVENRYRFQGREWDENLQAYYYRYRLYFPETGTFSGPDILTRISGNGPNDYVFGLNNPLSFLDPMGLEHTVLRSAAYFFHVIGVDPVANLLLGADETLVQPGKKAVGKFVAEHPRAVASVQLVGATLETGGGLFGTTVSYGGTLFFVVHGADNFQAALRTLVSGEYKSTVVQTVAEGASQKLTGSKTSGTVFVVIVDIASGLGGSRQLANMGKVGLLDEVTDVAQSPTFIRRAKALGFTDAEIGSVPGRVADYARRGKLVDSLFGGYADQVQLSVGRMNILSSRSARIRHELAHVLHDVSKNGRLFAQSASRRTPLHRLFPYITVNRSSYGFKAFYEAERVAYSIQQGFSMAPQTAMNAAAQAYPVAVKVMIVPSSVGAGYGISKFLTDD